jgi:hypothetical protein
MPQAIPMKGLRRNNDLEEQKAGIKNKIKIL